MENNSTALAVIGAIMKNADTRKSVTVDYDLLLKALKAVDPDCLDAAYEAVNVGDAVENIAAELIGYRTESEDSASDELLAAMNRAYREDPMAVMLTLGILADPDNLPDDPPPFFVSEDEHGIIAGVHGRSARYIATDWEKAVAKFVVL